MVKKMDELPLEELEAIALEWVRKKQGCDHVEAVNIKPLDVQGTAPNGAGRPKIDRGLRDLIQRMSRENRKSEPSWSTSLA